jgi:hypothetical protein
MVLTTGTFGTRSASHVFVLSMANNHHQANHHGCSLHSADLDKSEEIEQIIVINSSNETEIPPALQFCTSGYYTRSHVQKISKSK